MATYTLVRTENLKPIRFECTKTEGNEPYDWIDATVVARFKKGNTTFEKECLIEDEINLIASCVLTNDDLDVGNTTYEGELVVTFSSGRKDISVEKFELEVRNEVCG